MFLVDIRVNTTEVVGGRCHVTSPVQPTVTVFSVLPSTPFVNDFLSYFIFKRKVEGLKPKDVKCVFTLTSCSNPITASVLTRAV